MSGSFGTLNTKYNILLNELRNKTGGGGPSPPGPTTSTLADVMLNGNSAGGSDLDMNGQSIVNAPSISNPSNMAVTAGIELDLNATSGSIVGIADVEVDFTATNGSMNLLAEAAVNVTSNSGDIYLTTNTGSLNLSSAAIIGIQTLNDAININCGTNLGLSAALGDINLDTPNGHVVINGSQYPPNLQQVLTAGNSAPVTQSIILGPGTVGSLPLFPTIRVNGSTAPGYPLSFYVDDGAGNTTVVEPAAVTLQDSATALDITASSISFLNGASMTPVGFSTTNSNVNATRYLNFSETSTDAISGIYKTTGISCNPSTKTITATTFTGSLSGTATNASNVNNAGLVANQNYPLAYFATNSTGFQQLSSDTGGNHLLYNPGTNTLNLSGNQTISGSASVLTVNGTGTAISAPNATAISFPAANVTATTFTGATESLTSNGTGYNVTPQVTLTNNLATAGATTGVPSIKYTKTGRNAVAGDAIGSQHFYANNSSGTNIEFARIEVSVRNTGVSPNNDDGSIAFSGLINGVLSEFFRINGADSENNMFLPLDMNGQSIKSSSGSMVISTASSTGTGTITLTPKVAGNLIFQNLPTSVVGLPTGAVWNNLGVLNIAP